jgi:hypothetical protein
VALVGAFLPSIPLAYMAPMWARATWALVVPLGLIARHLEARYSRTR